MRSPTRHIVVATGPQPFYSVVNLTKRGKNEDGRVVFLGPQGADQGQTIHFRQHAVDDRDIVSAFDCKVVAVDAVVRQIDHMTRLAEGFDLMLHGAPLRVELRSGMSHPRPLEGNLPGHIGDDRLGHLFGGGVCVGPV